MIAGLAQRHRLEYDWCTRRKDGTFGRGTEPWNKGTKGVMKANKTSFKKGENAIPLQERFEAKVIKGEQCWIWNAHKNNKGYGVINVDGKVVLAHRVAYQTKYGPIPEGMKILHECDNPRCVNPNHLRLGTQLENMQDMYRKGRASLGEDRTQSKLTFAMASYVRRRYAEGDISQRELAKEVGISQAILCDVINFKRWK